MGVSGLYEGAVLPSNLQVPNALVPNVLSDRRASASQYQP